jgi:hypothetical protein
MVYFSSILPVKAVGGRVGVLLTSTRAPHRCGQAPQTPSRLTDFLSRLLAAGPNAAWRISSCPRRSWSWTRSWRRPQRVDDQQRGRERAGPVGRRDGAMSLRHRMHRSSAVAQERNSLRASSVSPAASALGFGWVAPQLGVPVPRGRRQQGRQPSVLIARAMMMMKMKIMNTVCTICSSLSTRPMTTCPSGEPKQLLDSSVK